MPVSAEEPVTDAELMKRLQMGDMEAMDPLYRRYRGVVSAVIHG